MRDILSSNIFHSRIHSEDTQKCEQILGYFLGPCLVYMMYYAVAGTYLTQFYTDVLGLAGGFLTMMPLFSKILSGITSFLIGRMIDRTHTCQGKARPWLFASGFLLSACGGLLYIVPMASYEIQITWVVISYNLFFDIAFAIYTLSHSLMVPLSTRNTRQRDTLAMLTSTGTAMIPGIISTILMPILISNIGVGRDSQGAWITVMGILSILAIPATLVEYYFTLERVTSEAGDPHTETVPFAKQISACFHDKYWLIILGFTFVIQLCNGLSTNSMLYYCNWVLGNSVESGATKQILVNMIGQAPMGFGVAILWPLVRKFGKRNVTMFGFLLAAIGSFLVLLSADNLTMVLICLFIKSIGAVPTYVMASLLAEALDHVEWKHGFRADGFSASVNSIIQTVVMGLAQTLLLAGVTVFGYITPESSGQILFQPEAVRSFFSWCFAGLPMIGYGICALLMLLYDLEPQMPAITKEISLRKRNHK